jgi:copper transport protein
MADSLRRRRLSLRVRALGVLGTALAISILAPAYSAQAHAFLQSSNPADGSVVASAPRSLELGFSESVVLGATRVDVVDGQGHHVRATSLRLVSSGSPEDTENPVQVVANLPALSGGVYRVSWETLSSDDLHRTSGVLVFGVGTGQAPPAAGLAEPLPRLDEASLRWLVLLSLSLCLGGALAARLLRSAGPTAATAARTASRWSMVGAAAGTVVAVLLLVDQLLPGAGAARQLLAGSYSERWLLREAGLVVLLVAAVLALRERPARLRPWLLVAGAALAAVGTSLLGHSGAGVHPAVTRVIADAAHLVAATTWAGTLVVLVLVAGPRWRSGIVGAGTARSVLRGFGPPAAACVSVMVVTGVYLTSGVVGSVDAALLTVYGRVLLLKVAVVVLAGVMALMNTRRLRARPRADDPMALPGGSQSLPGQPTPVPARSTTWSRRALTVEVCAALVALGLAAILTSAQPAREPQLVDSPAPVASKVVDGVAGDLQETVSISPNRPGASVLLVEVFDTRRPSPGPVREILVTFVGPSGPVEGPRAARLTDGRWSLPTRLVEPGSLRVQVLVRRGGLPDVTRSFVWTVGGGQVSTRVAVVSAAPLGGLLEGAAAVFGSLILALWLLVPLLLRRRGRRRSSSSAKSVARANPDAPADRVGSADRVGPTDPAGPPVEPVRQRSLT